MALMPLTRINPGHYSFSWKSLSTIYTIFLWILLTILVLIVGQERFHILENTKQFDEYIIAIMFVIYLTPHFWIPLMVWTEATEVALYINSWAPFQVSNFCSYLVQPTFFSILLAFVLVAILSSYWCFSAISWSKIHHCHH